MGQQSRSHPTLLPYLTHNEDRFTTQTRRTPKASITKDRNEQEVERMIQSLCDLRVLLWLVFSVFRGETTSKQKKGELFSSPNRSDRGDTEQLEVSCCFRVARL